MAQLSGSEPISAENLADVLGSSNLGRDLLYAGGERTLSQDRLILSCGLGEYESFEIVMRNSAPGSAGRVTVPASIGDYDRTFASTDGLTTTANVIVQEYGSPGGEVLELDSNSSSCVVLRVYGIRAGGGQLLADILAALKGVA